MKRINIITAYFPPYGSAGANRLHSFSKTLHSSDFDVEVTAPFFWDKETNSLDFGSITKFTKFVGTNSPRHSCLLRRFWDEWKIASRLIAKANVRPADFTLLTSPYLAFLLLSVFRRVNGKLIIDVRDLTWEYMKSKNLIAKVLLRVLKFWSLTALKGADLVIVTNDAEYDHLRPHLLPKRLIKIANGIELDFLSNLRTQNSKKSKIGSKEEQNVFPQILYAGTLGKAQGIEILIELACLTDQYSVKILGAGPSFKRIESFVEKQNLGTVTLQKTVSRNAMPAVYSACDILFLRLVPGFETAVPSKIYEYLGAARPIVYMGQETDSAWRVLKKYKETFLVVNEEITELLSVLQKVQKIGPLDIDERHAGLANVTREHSAKILVRCLEERYTTLG